MSEEPTTPRRSSRIIQTGLSVKPARSFKRSYAWTWPQKCLDSADVDVPASDEEDAHAFFPAIIRRDPSATGPNPTTTSRIRLKSAGASKQDAGEVFRIGDTVLVDTQNSSFPSVAVIVALWQPRTNGGSELSDTDTDGDGEGGNPRDGKWWVRTDDKPQPCVRVHWFVQPSELPKVRAPRDHAAVSIFQPSRQLKPES